MKERLQTCAHNPGKQEKLNIKYAVLFLTHLTHPLVEDGLFLFSISLRFRPEFNRLKARLTLAAFTCMAEALCPCFHFGTYGVRSEL